MSKQGIRKIARNVQKTMVRYSPEILTGIGIAGMITTAGFCIKGTTKAMQLIELEKENKDVEKLTPKEVVKTTWKCYIPSAVTCTLSAACLIGATSTNSKRNAALAAAYTLSERAFSEYKEQVIESIGEEKEREVSDNVVKKRIERNPASKSEVTMTNRGNDLCYETLTGRYFRSDMQTIKDALNRLNEKILSYDYVSLTEWFDELGLSSTELSDLWGWRLDDGLVKIDFGSHIADDGSPCLAIRYDIPPQIDFQNFA